MGAQDRDRLTNSHWGAYWVGTEGGKVVRLTPLETDEDPSPIGQGVIGALDAPSRIRAPAVRKSWLEGGPGTRGDLRGEEGFVEVSWEEVNRLVAGELTRVREAHGNRAIYAGSYGWASAGRFHHAQSQLKRFLNCIGGFTRSVNSYSHASGEVILPHILGDFDTASAWNTSWSLIAKETDLFVAFGGTPLKNGQISQGGTGGHVQKEAIRAASEAGVRFVNISPLRSDVMDEAGAEWLALRPSTDTALMLGLARVLVAEGLADREFLDRYTVGFERFAAYLSGESDGVEKSADWAAEITEVPAETIRDLARRMAAGRTMISVAYSLTRQDHGEQTHWAAVALAALLGQIGLPGGGVGFGYSAMNYSGSDRRKLHFASMPQGNNRVLDFIPVARIADMLENPGGRCDYNGRTLTYPDVRLVWWAGGNPFHHHQDLNRLRRAWARPETVIVSDWCWTSVARHADIVLPATHTLERTDVALNPRDRAVTVMDAVVEPVGLARDDHEILRGIAAEMGVEEAFTEGRSPADWQRWLYDRSRQSAARAGVEMPGWEEFQEKGWFQTPLPDVLENAFEAFRADPEGNRLRTPSGRIELYSERIAGFGYDDCPGHPAWIEPLEWLGGAPEGAPLHLVTNQPATKLHSQLDQGPVSRADRIEGREPVLMHPEDAAERGLSEGQIVRVFNGRGACCAGLRIGNSVRRGVVQMATGAWYDPDGMLCRHGNPNVLTPDKGTSKLAQGPIAHTCMVEVAAWEGALPPVRIFEPPVIEPRREAAE